LQTGPVGLQFGPHQHLGKPRIKGGGNLFIAFGPDQKAGQLGIVGQHGLVLAGLRILQCREPRLRGHLPVLGSANPVTQIL